MQFIYLHVELLDMSFFKHMLSKEIYSNKVTVGCILQHGNARPEAQLVLENPETDFLNHFWAIYNADHFESC